MSAVRCLVAVLVVALLGMARAAGEVPRPALRLPVNTSAAARLKAAADAIRKEDWEGATAALQALLDRKDDAVVPVVRSDGSGRPVTTFVGVRGEARRLLRTLPAEGRAFYEATYNPRASALLHAALKANRPEALAAVADRFLDTPAGPEALSSLAHHYAGARIIPLAAANYARLLRERAVARWATDELYEATVVFRRAGDEAHADHTARELLERAAVAPLRLGSRSRTREQLAKELAALRVEGRGNWAVYRGDTRRDADGSGGPPLLSKAPVWWQPLVVEPDGSGTWGQVAARRLRDSGQPILPALFPVTATARLGGGKTVPLVVYRSYWGIHALDGRTGRLQWEADSRRGLDRMLRRGGDSLRFRAMTTWLQSYVEQNRHPAMVFGNSVCGSLSADDNFVYAVDDFGVPPTDAFDSDKLGPAIREAVRHNQLHAYGLAVGGKLAWRLGDPEVKDEWTGSFFLGPPLPLAGRIYLLNEKNQEIRLVCIDPTARNPEGYFTAKGLSVCPLVKTAKGLADDPLRRAQALHPAFGGGILVCPTNAGVIAGIDLLSHTIAWAYPYRDKTDVPPTLPVRRRWLPNFLRPMPPQAWHGSAPVIQGDKVVFTAPDSASLHCLNLRDGSPIWSRKRQDGDLYLAGVHKDMVLIVGTRRCRALRLADGSMAWTLETGEPSGQGAASDNVYYLPLAHGLRDNQPEICAIDLTTGRPLAHTKTPRGETPGNLLFHGGLLVSQTATGVAAYSQLRPLLARIDRLRRDRDDAEGLTARGLWRLHQDNLAGAIADLERVLDKDNVPSYLQERARTALYRALTACIQRDANAGRRYRRLYESACTIRPGVGGVAEPAWRRTEEGRRQSNFLTLQARLREEDGEWRDAYDDSLRFADLGPGEEMLSLVTDPGVTIRRDAWVRARVTGLLRRAPAVRRRQMEEELANRLKELQETKTFAKLPDFVRLFGPESSTGREARLLWAGRLIAQGKDLPAADRALQEVRDRRDDPARAARALAALAWLQAQRGLPADAVYYYRRLARDFPAIVVERGKTGKQLYDDLTGDMRFRPYLASPGPAWPGKVVATATAGRFPMPAPSFTFAHTGERLPFFRRHEFRLRFDLHRLKLYDTATREGPWGAGLSRTRFQDIAAASPATRFAYHNIGHLVLLLLGQRVFAIDPVGHRILWEKSLWGHAEPHEALAVRQVTADPRDHGVRVRYAGGWVQWLGSPLALTPSALCVVTPDGLEALDPVTGDALWRRADVAPGSRLFSNGRLVYVVATAADGKPTATRAFHTADGSAADVPDFTRASRDRLHVRGGGILLSEAGTRNAVRLRMYDVRSGKSRWTHTYPAMSIVLRPLGTPLGGVVEPTGGVRILDLDTGDEVFRTAVRREHLEGVTSAAVLADERNVYLLLNRPLSWYVQSRGGLHSNLAPGTGLRAAPVNGTVYAFDRETGKVRLCVRRESQMLVLNRFAALPALLFTSRYRELGVGDGKHMVASHVPVVAVDKYTGKLLFEMNRPDLPPFYALDVAPDGRRVTFTSPALRVLFRAEEAGLKGRK